MPIHPVLVHFPVALLLFGVLLDVLGVLRRDDRLQHAGYFSLIGGVAGAVLAVISGFVEADRLQERMARLRDAAAGGGGPAGGGFPGGGFGFPGGEAMAAQMLQNVAVHRLLALAALAVFLVLLLWRMSRKGALPARAGSYLVVALLGASILASAGFLGGKLAHGRRPGPDRAGPDLRLDRPAGTGVPSGGSAAPGGRTGGGQAQPGAQPGAGR